MARRRGRSWVAEAYDPVTKQKKHLGTCGTKGEARDLEAAFRASRRQTGTSSETCDSFAGRWVNDYPRPRASTNKNARERLSKFITDFAGVRLADVDKPRARKWALENPSRVKVVRTMFGDAERDGIIPINPFSALRLPGSRGRKDIVALTEPELVQLADTALDPRMELGDYAREYRAMILFAGYTGIRPGELFALQAVDIRGDQARIDKSFSSRTGETTVTKTGNARDVVIPPAALTALADVTPHPIGHLFVSPGGKPWRQVSHNRYWERLRLIADRPGLALYELRHCAATLLLERGVTPWDVAIQLGHDDGGILVARLYGHPTHAGALARVAAAYGVTGPGPTPITDLQQKRRKTA